MIWQRVRVALLASMVAMAAALPVARGGKAHAGQCGSCGSAPASAPAGAVSAAPAYRTVTVTELVPEYYTTTRTVNRQEQVQEKYTAYRIERVPETKTRTVTLYDKVPTCETRTRTVYESVPVCEERVCQEKRWVCKQVTTVHRKCVDNGHYECRQVEVTSHKKKCCDPCNSCCEPACPKYKTVRCWVPNKCYIETPCTKTVKVCEYYPVKKMVHTCKKVAHVETYTVNVCKCVAHTKTETYTCCVERKIPFECTRTVCKCVPVTEQVKCCRMVKKCVEKQVPVCNPCEDTCKPCGRKKLFSKCCD